MAATDYEKLGVFYLGKEYDLAAGTRRPELVLYDSKDLVTHAVCVGMTGSGKTGLGIGLIEEAALDGVPVLAIDPKGDLANLLLTFPDLAPGDFAPWVDAVRRDAPQPHARGLRRAAGRAVEERPGRLGPRRRPHRAAARRGGLPPLHARQPRRRAAGAAQLAERAARREPRRRAHADHHHGLEPAGARRLERRRAAQPRAGARRRHPGRRAHARARVVRPGRPALAGRRDSEAPIRPDRRARSRDLLPGQGPPGAGAALQQRAGDARFRRVARRRPARRRLHAATRPRASRAWRSCRLPTSATPSACSWCRCSSAPCSTGRAGRAARARCGPCSTWTKCSATCRRWPTRRRKRPCSPC